MECSNILEHTLHTSDIRLSLFKGSAEKELITELQRILFELGFSEELNWAKFQADGKYGKATTAAVAAFAKRNKFESNGEELTNDLAELILQRHSFLSSMYILWGIQQSDLRTKKFLSRGTKMNVSAIQVLLNELGYGKQLNFEKYGADGIFGKNTRKAVIAFCKDNGVESDGDLLTRPMVDLLISKINDFYGKNWSKQAKNNLPAEQSPLVLYEGSRFQGKPCQADILFVPMLEKINAYAEQAGVFVHVTSSFRTTTNVRGAIVTPAQFSNHMAGHGIDMNVVFGDNQFANSTVLANFPMVPDPVRNFIQAVINDPDLRWGGNFAQRDPVHIDDGLNRDMAKWRERFEVMQKAVQLGEFA